MMTGGFTSSYRGVSVLEDWEMREPPPPIVVTSVVVGSDACQTSFPAPISASPPPPTPTTDLEQAASLTATVAETAVPASSEVVTKQNDTELEELRAMVSKTKGYFARDWSLYLGWNNMRYIIEAALEQSRLLNRTLILPSFVYARACEWEIEFCAAFAPMVNRGKAVDSTAWDTLPAYQQIAYRIPMEEMLDTPHLRKLGHPVVLTSQFLRLSGLNDPDLETSKGNFDKEKYLGTRAEDGSKMTLFVVKNDEYDPHRVIRVDRVGPLADKFGRFAHGDVGTVSMKLWEKVDSKQDHTMIRWEEARDIVKEDMKDPGDDEELEKVLAGMGWVAVHTWDGWSGMEWLKSVVQPVKQIAPLRSLRGWQEDYAFLDHDVVLLEGEIHLGRKPGAMFFSTPEARDAYAKIVLEAVRPIDKIRELGEKLGQRMKRRVGGRMWMAAHMRRGDFIREGWVMEQNIGDHLLRIKEHLANGSRILHGIHERREVITFHVPDVEPDQTQITLEPPEDGDPFFLATDERFANNLIWLRQNNAVLISDLLTPQDRREFGWPIMITDVLALVEQVVISHSYYFYAHAMSSLAGGAVNMRAGKGKDYRTSWID
ncbi:hypothetical protein FRC04_008413 [Tulasnella sp. 424]|nr:hypothetical protein FRC04_008413 [Tulasnella sp. 424]